MADRKDKSIEPRVLGSTHLRKVKMHHVHWGYRLVLAMVIGSGPLSVFAATLPEQQNAAQQAEQIQRQQFERLEQERREELLKQPKTSIGVEQPGVVSQPLEGACRDIKQIVVEGASRIPEAKLKKITAPYIGTCMTVGDIERLLGTLTKYYVDRGLIATRVYVQPQDLATGVLRIMVVEGTIEKILLEDGKGGHSANLRTALPGVEFKPLNLRDFEQGLDQINRLLSNHATISIQPGEHPGGSIVVIRNQPGKRLYGSLTLDNYGSSSTGEPEAGMSGTLDNPLGLNDMLSVSYRRTTDTGFSGRHARTNTFYYSVPFGYLTLTGSYLWSDYATTLHLPSSDLISSGSSTNTALAADYVVHRDTVNRVSVSGTLTRKVSENYLAGELLSISSRTLTTFDLGTSWSTRLGGGVASLGVDHTWGLKLFSALEDPSNLSDSSPHAQFRKWTANIAWTRPFRLWNGRDITYSTTLSGQYGVDVLYGSEQFSVGGLYSVRGFRDGSISGDRGYYWRNDLSMPFSAQIGKRAFVLRPYVGFDMGSVMDRGTATGGNLSGAAIGLSASDASVHFDMLAAKALSKPDSLSNEGVQVFAKLAVDF